MAVTNKLYSQSMYNLLTGDFGDLELATLKVALLDNTYSFDQDNHEEWADVSTHEVSGTG